MVRAFIVLSLAVTFYFALEAKAQEECSTVFKGCSIVGKLCECGSQKACENPWQFPNGKACRKSTFRDQCIHYPCQNGGVCVQHKEKRAGCNCAGTGYYGDFCEIQCPATEEMKRMNELPTACIIP